MATDRTESSRHGRITPRRTAKHPYAAIDHRVIDSPAFADLKPSAQALMLFMARQLTKDNNGHLQASFNYVKRFGVGSEHTLRSAIAELISHGFIYRTRSHGANGAWAKYAVTWLPITKKEGLFLTGFQVCMWRDWKPAEKKTTRQKMQDTSSRKCSFTTVNPAETAGSGTVETAAYELMPCRGVFSAIKGDWMTGYLARLASRALVGQQCFQIPAAGGLQ